MVGCDGKKGYLVGVLICLEQGKLMSGADLVRVFVGRSYVSCCLVWLAARCWTFTLISLSLPTFGRICCWSFLPSRPFDIFSRRYREGGVGMVFICCGISGGTGQVGLSLR